MRAAAILALCACQAGSPPASKDKPVAPATIVAGTVVVDGDHACAITTSHKVTCWGATPAEVPDLDDVAVLAADERATCAWTTHGTVKCWGDDPKPKPVPALGGVVQVTVGGSQCALRANGRVACWSNDSSDAREVAGLAGVVEIAGTYSGGAELLCARLKSGGVMCGNSVRPFEAVPQL